jgi:hypothetical protein
VRQAVVRRENHPESVARVATIEAALNEPVGADATRRLLQEVDRGLSKQEVTLRWEDDDNIGPRKVMDADYVARPGPNAFLRYVP